MRPYSLPTEMEVAPILPSLDRLPAYLSVPLPVSARPISQERHWKIHAKILLRIVDDVSRRVVPPKVAGWRSAVRHGRAVQFNLEDWEAAIQNDIYAFIKTEKSSKPFIQLTQLPSCIDVADIIEGRLSGGPLLPESNASREMADAGPSSRVSILASPQRGKGMSLVVAEDSEPESPPEHDAVTESDGGSVLRPVGEDIDDSEVEDLL